MNNDNFMVFVYNAIIALFAFFVAAPMLLNAISLFTVQKRFAKVMVDEGVVKEETVRRLHPKKQVAGVLISLLVLAGLQSLPKSPFESAKIDGGSNWFNFRNLTLPMLRPSLYIALLFRLMAALQEYAVIYALTKGGPGDALMSLSLTAYQQGFKFQKFGAALPYILILWLIINVVAKEIVKRQRAAQKQAAGLDE